MKLQVRVVRRAGVIALVALVGYVLIGLPLFVFPPSGPVPQHADVALVLGPPNPDRIDLAIRLLDEGHVDAVLISMPYPFLPPQYAAVCSRTHVTCADPDPRTTRGEARMLRTYAARQDWSDAVVVTMGSHLVRAHSLLQRCFAGRLTMLASGEPPYRGWAFQYLYQTAATVKTWFLPGC